MIKRIQTKEVVSTLKKGVDVFYFDRKTNKFIKLEEALGLLPGVFLVEDNTILEKKTQPKAVLQGKGNSRRKNIDKNKVKDLREAGWTPKAIAGEMNVSLQTIYYHLRNI